MAAEEEVTLMEMLSGERGGGGFIPLLVGLVAAEGGGEGEERIVLVNPMTQGMVVLQGDAGILAEILSRMGGRRGPPPASKASIEGMRTVNLGEEEEEECPVCLEGMRQEGDEEEEVVKEMPCRHRFHEGCIGKWLGLHGSCPVCRFRMPEEEGEEDARKGGDSADEEEEERRRGPRREVWVTIAIGRRGSGEGGGGGLED